MRKMKYENKVRNVLANAENGIFVDCGDRRVMVWERGLYECDDFGTGFYAEITDINKAIAFLKGGTL